VTRDGNDGHQGEFDGLLGLLAGLAMSFGRGRGARLVAELAEVGPGDRVVDVGCGPGRFLREAAERGAGAVGVDPSPQMRRVARWRTPASLRPGRGLAALRRVLRPGGRLVIAERLARPGRAQRHALTWQQAQDVAARAERAGFADVATGRRQLGWRQVVFVKARVS
jgi:ubiquinone/menaquinone biosynthesis C-methylase UbiE